MKTVSTANPPHAALRSAVGIGLAYLVAGALWILFSDAGVEAVSRHPDWLIAAQRYKGLVCGWPTANCRHAWAAANASMDDPATWSRSG